MPGVCSECVKSEAEGHATCLQCGHRLMPADKSVASINDRAWCVLTVRAGRDRCDGCGRMTDPHGAAIPFWEAA